MENKPRKTSAIIHEIIEECQTEGSMTIDQFMEKLGNRALALAILVFSISTVIAGIVPGFSTLTGIPILFIALHMVAGKEKVWLPKDFRNKELPPKVISGSLAQSLPSLRRVEKLLKPRLLFLTNKGCERFIALFMVGLAIILSLPIPGGNFLPSISIAVLALALLERDGVLVLLAIGSIFLTGGLMIELIDQAIIYTHEFIQWLF